MSNINPKVRTASLYFIRRPPRVRLHGHGTARLADCPTGAVLFSTGRRAPVSRVRCRGFLEKPQRAGHIEERPEPQVPIRKYRVGVGFVRAYAVVACRVLHGGRLAHCKLVAAACRPSGFRPAAQHSRIETEAARMRLVPRVANAGGIRAAKSLLSALTFGGRHSDSKGA
ncbi:hypothetical protein HPB51_014336 [Rhipicephalus microplus]|uniref:Uncharacterized protein n=1 Tax=Rhipicephalus microplus TaxID=6941 RepID=A0A9J6EN85_RHIMP|nr:hypothetical protein HPB51_014336 [Rhipicephalus microplus]